MNPIEDLKDDHQLILRVLKVIEQLDDLVEKGNPFPTDLYKKIIRFIQFFADRCHHCKEEDRLFPMLEKRGIPNENGPISCMLRDHQRARQITAQAEEQLEFAIEGDAQAEQLVRELLMDYCILLDGHINREDKVLFEMADQVMSDADKSQLETEFIDAVEETVGSKTCGHLRKSVEMLEQKTSKLLNVN